MRVLRDTYVEHACGTGLWLRQSIAANMCVHGGFGTWLCCRCRVQLKTTPCKEAVFLLLYQETSAATMRALRAAWHGILHPSLVFLCLSLFLAKSLHVAMQPSRTPRKQPQHLARAFSAAAHAPSASKPVNSRRGHGPSSPPASPPDSPRSTGGFSAFSDGDWEENLADNVKVTVCKLGGWARGAGCVG